jgi:hypothetical protein
MLTADQTSKACNFWLIRVIDEFWPTVASSRYYWSRSICISGIHPSSREKKRCWLQCYVPPNIVCGFRDLLPMNTDTEDFYIVPRGALSKDTCLKVASLEKYKSAWHLLWKMMQRNNRLSWQLQSVISGRRKPWFAVEMIRTAKE